MSTESETIPETPEDSITAEKLKAGAHSFLKQNAEKVKDTGSFKDFGRRNEVVNRVVLGL